MIGIIINPLSGNGQGKKTWIKVQKELDARKTAYIYKATSFSGEALEIAMRMVKVDQVKRIIAIGGDGTINEVVRGIVAAEGASRCPLAVIPAGTGNDYAKAHGIPSNPLEALKLALSPASLIKQIDLIQTNSSILALNNIGAGFDGLVAKLTNEAAYKKLLNQLKLGSLAYFITMLRVFTTYKNCTIWLEIDGTSYELTYTWLAATANIPYYGGSMQICPHALPDDGYLDIVVIRSSSRWKVLSILFSVYSGKHINHPAVSFYKGRSISIRSAAPLLLQADGEAAGETPLQLRIIPLGLSIVAGR